MRKYIEHIKNTRTPHERRMHALQVAGVVTALVFVVWIGTLGIRLAPQAPAVASDDSNQTANSDLPAQAGQTSLTATALQAQANRAAHLEVSTTSVYSN